MKKPYMDIILLIALAITLYGLVTGRYLFLFLVIPLGFGWFRNNKKSDE